MKKCLLTKYLPKLIAIGIIVFFSLMEGAAGADAIAGTRLSIVGNNALVSYVSASLEGMKG